MKLQYGTSTVDNTGSLATARATIDLNPTIAHVLSRDLYQRPIESMFREVLINAIDAHIEANQTRAVDIKLPNIWDNQFYIRDYGTGLSHDRLMAIYLAYGSSSRRDSNAVHGGLGLGTKSPLAYTSAFAVTSFFNGVKNEYIIYYDENNLPCVDHRFSSPSDEPSGLLVSLPTQLNDSAAFASAAKTILSRIPKEKFNLVDTQLEIIYNDDVMRFGKLAIVPKTNSSISIIMGYVAYAFDSSAIIKFLEDKDTTLQIDKEQKKASSVLRALTTHNSLEIYASIGEYPVHPSREYINITPRAVKTFIADLEASLDIMFDDFSSLDINKDILLYRLTDIVPESRASLKVRVRVLPSRSWMYQRNVVSNQLETYKDLINALSRETAFVTGQLTQFQMTDYLGNGRTYYTYPDFVELKSALLVIDKENTHSDVLACVQTLEQVDLVPELTQYLEQIETSRRVQENTKAYVSTWPRQRAPSSKSIQDPSHNILMLNYGVTGGIKADWSSSKHNVQSLLALKREIFWVPTRMGCASPGNRSLIQDCLPIMNVLPTHLKPLIIGLPASKGTLTIERAFKPISGLEAFIKKRVQSDYFQRRLRLAQAAQYVHSVVYHDSLVLISEYKPAKKLLRYFNLMHKHNLSAFTRLVSNKDVPITTPIDLEPLERDVGTKFPVLYFGRWTYQNRISDTAIKQWAAEVARYTGN